MDLSTVSPTERNLTHLTRNEISRRFNRWTRLSLQKRIPSFRGLKVSEIVQEVSFNEICMRAVIDNVEYSINPSRANLIRVGKRNDQNTNRYVKTALKHDELVKNLLRKVLCENNNKIIYLKFYNKMKWPSMLNSLPKVTASIDTVKLWIDNTTNPQSLKILPRPRILLIHFNSITQDWILPINDLDPQELDISVWEPFNFNFHLLTSKVLKINIDIFSFNGFVQIAKKLASGDHSAESECKGWSFSERRFGSKEEFFRAIREAFHENKDEIIENEDNLSIRMCGDLLLRVWWRRKGGHCRVEKRYSPSEPLTSSSRYETFRQLKKSKRVSLQKRIPTLRNLKVTEIINKVLFARFCVVMKINDMRWNIDETGKVSRSGDHETSQDVDTGLTMKELVMNMWRTFLCQDGNAIEELHVDEKTQICWNSLPKVTARINKLSLLIGKDTKLKPQDLKLFTAPRELTAKFKNNITQDWIHAINNLNPQELYIKLVEADLNCELLTSKVLKMEFGRCTFNCFKRLAKKLASGAYAAGSKCFVHTLSDSEKGYFVSGEAFLKAIREPFIKKKDVIVMNENHLDIPISDDLFLKAIAHWEDAFRGKVSCRVVESKEVLIDNTTNPQRLKRLPRHRKLIINFYSITQEWIQAINNLDPQELYIKISEQGKFNMNFQTLTPKVLKIKIDIFNFNRFIQIAKNSLRETIPLNQNSKLCRSLAGQRFESKEEFFGAIREAFHEDKDGIIENKDNLSIPMAGDLLLRVWWRREGGHCRVEKRYSSSEPLTSSSRYEIFRQFKKSKRISLQKRIPSFRNFKVTEVINDIQFEHSNVCMEINDMTWKIDKTGKVSRSGDHETSRYVDTGLTMKELVTKMWRTFLCQEENTIGELCIDDNMELDLNSLPKLTASIKHLSLSIDNGRSLNPQVLKLFTTPQKLLLRMENITQDWIFAINNLDTQELYIEIGEQIDSDLNFELLTSKVLKMEFCQCTFNCFVRLAKQLASGAHAAESKCEVWMPLKERNLESEEEFVKAICEAFTEKENDIVVDKDHLKISISDDLFLRVSNDRNVPTCRVVNRKGEQLEGRM